MAITKLTSPATPNPLVIGAGGDWALMLAQLTACKILLGDKNNMLLTEWTTTTVPQLAKGAYLTHLGAVYIIDTANFDIAIGDLAGAGTYYIKLTTSGDTLTVAWEDSLSGYDWDLENQGYYNGTSQILPYVSIFDGAASHQKRRILNLPVDDTGNFILADSGGKFYLKSSDLYFNDIATNHDHILFNETDNQYEFYADDDGSKTSFGRLQFKLAAAAGTTDTLGTLADKAEGQSSSTYTLLETSPIACVLRISWNAVVDNAAAEATYTIYVDSGSVDVQTTSSTSEVPKTYDVTLAAGQTLEIKLEGDNPSYISHLHDLTIKTNHTITNIEQALFDVGGMVHS